MLLVKSWDIVGALKGSRHFGPGIVCWEGSSGPAGVRSCLNWILFLTQSPPSAGKSMELLVSKGWIRDTLRCAAPTFCQRLFCIS